MSDFGVRMAVCVALVPQEPFRSLLVARSEELDPDGNSAIRLNTQNAMPHLTIWMSEIASGTLTELFRMISSLDQNFSLKLKGEKIVPSGNEGKSLVHLLLEESEELIRLHRVMVKRLEELALDLVPSPSSFAGDGIGESSLRYLSDFLLLHSGRNYSPHITLGYGSEIREWKELGPYAFDLKVYQLANGCTCCRELSSG